MHTGLQHQQPLRTTAAVRSVPSPQHGARMHGRSDRQPPEAAAVAAEDKSFGPPPKP
jgi:hypothetical protein